MKTIQPHSAEPFAKYVRNIMPGLLEEFLKHEKRVIDHPRQKKEFHKMRIAGKPLRYMMAIIQPVFGAELKECLNDIEAILDQMGTIHDCDVGIDILSEYVAEQHSYNASLKEGAQQIPLGAAQKVIGTMELKRETSFKEFCERLRRWKRDQMRSKLFNSIAS